MAAAGSGSLYIGDLHPDVTESQLFDEFKVRGPIISVRVCRDTVTRKSLGYAYVNYQNPVDAERAIDTLNHLQILGRPVRIMWSQRDPAARRSGAGNVFVKGLEKSIDNKALYDYFSTYGNILSCKVMLDDKGESKGFGFVHFDADEAAKKACEELNGQKLRDQEIFVGPFIKRSQRQSGVLSRFTNVYVKQILDLDAEELKEKFSCFGEVTSTFTKRDPSLHKVFGFVNFAKHDEAVKAIEEWHGKEVEGLSPPGTAAYVQRAMKRAERELELRRRFLAEKAKRQFPPANNLYVKNLDEATTETELREMFAPYGEISTCVVMRDAQTKQTKGFGFVCFKEAEMAQKALYDMNGKLFGDKPLYVNIAQKKDARRSMLEMQYAQRRHMPPHAFMPPNPAYPMYYGAMPPPMYGKGVPPPPMPYGGRGAKGVPMRGTGAMRGGYQGRGGRPPKTMNMRAVQQQQQAAAQQQAAQQPPQEQPAADDAAQAPLTAESLAALSPEEQKTALGNQLFYKIEEIDSENAGKITGMLLEMDVSETLNLLESHDTLREKIAEAKQVLEQSSDKQ